MAIALTYTARQNRFPNCLGLIILLNVKLPLLHVITNPILLLVTKWIISFEFLILDLDLKKHSKYYQKSFFQLCYSQSYWNSTFDLNISNLRSQFWYCLLPKPPKLLFCSVIWSIVYGAPSSHSTIVILIFNTHYIYIYIA